MTRTDSLDVLDEFVATEGLASAIDALAQIAGSRMSYTGGRHKTAYREIQRRLRRLAQFALDKHLGDHLLRGDIAYDDDLGAHVCTLHGNHKLTVGAPSDRGSAWYSCDVCGASAYSGL